MSHANFRCMRDLISCSRNWISDEYGPFVYKFGANGQLIETLIPPQAILPYQNGVLNFTSATDPDTGRAANQGISSQDSVFPGNTNDHPLYL